MRAPKVREHRATVAERSEVGGSRPSQRDNEGGVFANDAIRVCDQH
jgi:hypothetical protein